MFLFLFLFILPERGAGNPNCLDLSPVEERVGDKFFVFSAVLGSIVDTNSASVYGDTGRSQVPPATGSHVLGVWAA